MNAMLPLHHLRELSILIEDLAIFVDFKLNFNEYIDYTCTKANRCLGYLIRSTYDFVNSYVIIHL